MPPPTAVPSHSIQADSSAYAVPLLVLGIPLALYGAISFTQQDAGFFRVFLLLLLGLILFIGYLRSLRLTLAPEYFSFTGWLAKTKKIAFADIKKVEKYYPPNARYGYSEWRFVLVSGPAVRMNMRPFPIEGARQLAAAIAAANPAAMIDPSLLPRTPDQ